MSSDFKTSSYLLQNNNRITGNKNNRVATVLQLVNAPDCNSNHSSGINSDNNITPRQFNYSTMAYDADADDNITDEEQDDDMVEDEEEGNRSHENSRGSIINQRRSSLDSLMKAAASIENCQFNNLNVLQLNDLYLKKINLLNIKNNQINNDIVTLPTKSQVNLNKSKTLILDSIDYSKIKDLFNLIDDSKKLIEDIIQLKKIKSNSNELYNLPKFNNNLLKMNSNPIKTVLPSINSLTKNINDHNRKSLHRKNLSDPINRIYTINSIKKIEKPQYIQNQPNPTNVMKSTSTPSIQSELAIAEHIRKNEVIQTSCIHCNEQDTPEWRRGPYGNRTLCNACGLFYRKLIKKFGIKNANLLMRYRQNICPQDRRVPSDISDVPTKLIQEFNDDVHLDNDYNTIQ